MITPVANRVELLVIRHQSEMWRQSNTGRTAAQGLERSRIWDFGLVESRTSDLDLSGAWLLHPGDGPPPEGEPTRLVVLDGSWGQARRMFIRIPGLSGLPRLSVRGGGGPRMRAAPAPDMMATIEAAAAAYAMLGEPSVSAHLTVLFEEQIRRHARCRGILPE